MGGPYSNINPPEHRDATPGWVLAQSILVGVTTGIIGAGAAWYFGANDTGTVVSGLAIGIVLGVWKWNVGQG